MKILLISNMYPAPKDPDYGIFVRNIEEGLKKQDDVEIGRAVIYGRSKGFLQKINSYIKFYSSIALKYYKNDFDVIYAHFLSHCSPILYLLTLLSFKKRKLIINVHGSDIIEYNKGIYKFFNKRLLKYIDLLIVPSIYLKGVVTGKYPHFDVRKIYISPSGGIDQTKFYPSRIRRESSRPVLGFVSRIEDDKGWGAFLKAAKLLRDKGITPHLLIAGKGSREEEMRAKIKENGMTEATDWKGVIPHRELNKLYNEMDLFIFPTRRESLGLVGLEAMACGIPVIGSRIAGLKTFIKDGINGYFFEPDNAKELAEKIQEFLSLSYSEKKKMSEAALEKSRSYEKDRIAVDLYKKILSVASL